MVLLRVKNWHFATLALILASHLSSFQGIDFVWFLALHWSKPHFLGWEFGRSKSSRLLWWLLKDLYLVVASASVLLSSSWVFFSLNILDMYLSVGDCMQVCTLAYYMCLNVYLSIYVCLSVCVRKAAAWAYYASASITARVFQSTTSYSILVLILLLECCHSYPLPALIWLSLRIMTKEELEMIDQWCKKRHIWQIYLYYFFQDSATFLGHALHWSTEWHQDCVINTVVIAQSW